MLARVLEPLDGRSSSVFLVAGGLLAVFAANTGARVFAGSGVPPVHSFVGPAGFFLGVLGVFGLFPGLAERRPGPAYVVAAVAAIPLVGWSVITVFGVGSTVGVLPDVSVVLPGVTVIVVFVTTMLTYVLVGATSLRADGHPTSVGLLLLAPAVPFLALMVAVGAMGPVVWGEFVIDTGHALAHLAVGIALRTEEVPTAHARSAPETTP